VNKIQRIELVGKGITSRQLHGIQGIELG